MFSLFFIFDIFHISWIADAFSVFKHDCLFCFDEGLVVNLCLNNGEKEWDEIKAQNNQFMKYYVDSSPCIAFWLWVR